MLILFAAALLPEALSATPMRLCYDPGIPPVRFAASEIRAAAARAGKPLVEQTGAKPPESSPGINIVLTVEPGRPAQSYSIRRRTSGDSMTYTITGGDAAGAMYGGLDIGEAIRLGTLGALADSDHTAHIARRGIKFNIPLDLRTPSYSDSGDAAQLNIPEMWSFDFWREFLDEMARDRYNVLTLWNLHPFPSMVKVPEYPDIALSDVLRTTAKLDDTFSHTGSDMVRPAMLRSAETVRKMSIDDKIRFWRDVMQYASDRGIETYVFTWNIFVWGTEEKHGITIAQDNLATIDYFRKSVREMVLTYPLLGTVATLGANFSLRSAACRHAVRLAVCVAAGDAVGRGFGLNRSYWLPMTIAIVLKPDFTATFSRGVLRLAGTFVGLVFATALFHVLPGSAMAQVAAIGVLLYLLRWLGPANYGILVVAVTALIVFLIGLTGAAPHGLVVARGLNTAIGGAIALLVYWVWPTWERSQAPELMAQMLDAYRDYFRGLKRRATPSRTGPESTSTICG